VLFRSNQQQQQQDDFDPHQLADIFAHKYQAAVERLRNNHLDQSQVPVQTVWNATLNKLVWQTTNNSWVRGFFPGVLWQIFDYTKDSTWKDSADYFTQPLKAEASDNTTHDVGFMVFSSFGMGVELGLMGQDYKDVVVQAAHTLASRYSPIVNMTRSWGGITDKEYFMVIVDNLLNLELLYWTGQHTNNQTLTDMATHHALRTTFPGFWLRPDGSTTHLCTFNPETGTLLTPCTATPQGLSANSTWARGQAWTIYGFTMVYRYTHQAQFLAAALDATAFFLANTPTLIPFWDYSATDGIIDTSTAAIVASAFFELAQYAPANQPSLSDIAKQLVTKLANDYVTPFVNDTEAVTTGNQKDCGDARCACAYTEYYLMEAVRRWIKSE